MEKSYGWRIQSRRRWSGIPRALSYLLLASVTVAAICQTPSGEDQKALDAFSKRVQQYTTMEHGLAADKMKPTSDMRELEQQRDALRLALQRARAKAKQGDLFTPDVAPVFRKLLAETMSGPDGAMIRSSLAHAEPGASGDLKVNSVFPDTAGQPAQSVPATLLLNLPRLPKGLQYAIAGKTLALRDDAANLVVDLLPNALP